MAKNKPGKRPYARETPFTLDASNAIVHHSRTIDELELERKSAFERRNNAISELDEIDDKESEEAHEAAFAHSQAVRDIDLLAAQIKFHRSELQSAIRKAVKDEEVQIFDFNPEAAKKRKDDDEAKKATGGKEIAGQMKLVGGEDLRPVGRPGKKPAAIVPMAADGVDEHLKVPVHELAGEAATQISDATVQALMQAGYDSIKAVAHVLDGPDGRIKLGNDIGKGEKVVASIVKAVDAFRTKHRKAMLAAQHEAMKAEAQKAQA